MKILNQNLKKPKSSKNIGIGIIISVNNFKFFDERGEFLYKFDLRSHRFVIYDSHDIILIETINNDFNREMVDPMIDIIVKYIIETNYFAFVSWDSLTIGDFAKDVIYQIKKQVGQSYEYQKAMIERGDLSKLKDVRLNDKILQEYPEMRDIKKQEDWN